MVDTKLNYLELPATDMEAAKAFYVRHFGWEWTDYGPGYAGSTSSGIEVALSASSSVGQAHDPGSQEAIGPFALFQADDIEPLHQAMQAEDGDVVVTEPYDFPGGRRFHFRDPSGNVLGVYQYDE